MERLKIINRNQLKYILIIAMIIDHIAWKFVPTGTLLGQIMHVIGRLTGPSMAILLAEGYKYTRDKKRYGLLAITYVWSYNDSIFSLYSYLDMGRGEASCWG